MAGAIEPDMTGVDASSSAPGERRTGAGNQVVTIAHLIGRWGIGGLEWQLAELVNRLPPERFRHAIVFRNGRDAVGPRVRDGVEIVCLDEPARNRRWAPRLAKLLRELRIDLVHNRELFTACDTVAACRLGGVSRTVFSFHGFTDAAAVPNAATRWRWRRALQQYRARWTVSASAASAIAETLRMPPESFSIIRNGVDHRRFRPGDGAGAIRRRLRLPTDRIILLAVGNVTAVKNHRLVLEAIDAAKLPPQSYTLVIVGEDRLGGRTQRWAETNLPGHDVRLVGPVADTLDWYRSADVFVLPSRSEGLCNALLEAMACGLAVVATDIAGNREVVRDGDSGFLVPVEDPARFGATLRQLIADAELRRRLGDGARERTAAKYDIDDTVEAYAHMYERLASGAHAKTAGPAFWPVDDRLESRSHTCSEIGFSSEIGS